LYNDSSSDFTPPTIQQTTATALDSTHVAFSVRAYDTNGSTTATTDPKLVYVLYRDSSTNVWKGVFLQQGAPGGPWTGGAAVGSTQIEYFVQSCDNAGNCSSTSDKARFFGAITQPNASQGGVTISAAGQSGANGWYTGAVTLTAADTAQNVVLNAIVDGGAPQAIANGGTITLSTSGVHTVEVDASDGGSAVKTVAIDVDNPKISFTVPADQATYPIGASVTVAYSCSDVGSGIQSCAGTQASGAALDTSTPGFHTFTVTATDNAGLTATATHTYQVLWPFNGFFDPVANTPTLNVIKVGQAVPVKFSLGANRGLSIFLPGYPATESINCLTDVASDPILQTVTAGSSSLTYDATSNQYTYVWKTPSSGWASGTCRQLVLGLLDKSVHVAYFKAK
jgi:hypothetical protein